MATRSQVFVNLMIAGAVVLWFSSFATAQVMSPVIVRTRLSRPNTFPVDQFGTIILDPGQALPYSFVASVDSDPRTVGLAGVVGDLIAFDIALPEMVRGSAMTNFDLPKGLANPPAQGSLANSGFGGTPVEGFPFPGSTSLAQVGGLQNTSGLISTGLCEVAFPVVGVGLAPAPVVVASGTLTAPVLVGVCTTFLSNVSANVLFEANNAPDISYSETATVVYDPYDDRFLQFIVVCRADFDNSGSVSVGDLFAFLDAWFAGSPAADFDRDGVLSASDIFAYLNAWFTSCKFP